MMPDHDLIKLVSIPIRRKRISVGSHRLAYIEAGSGPPLLLLHGINMGWGQWYPNIRSLAEKNTVYALDMPGAGDSTPLSSDHPRFAEELIEAVEGFISRQGWVAADVIGHSLGAWVALKVAARGKVPLRRIVAVSPLGFSSKTPSKYRLLGFRFFAKILARTALYPSVKHMRQFAISVLKRPDMLDDAFASYYFDALQRNKHDHPFLWINRFAGPFRMRRQFVLAVTEKEKIRLPVQIVVGAHDPLVPLGEHPARMFALPAGSFSVIPGAGHVAPTEQPDLFHAAVVQFLS